MFTEERKVTIVMPAYNCEKYVRTAIESILNQTYQNLELLIADDASTDNTRKIIESISDPRIVLHHNQVNCGYLATVNKLLQVGTGDYVTFQDADDWSDQHRINDQVDFLVTRNLQVCGTGVFHTSTSGKITGKTIFPLDSASILRNVSLGMSVVCYASLLFTREVLDTIGAYRPSFKYGAEDVDWFYRIIEQYNCENIERPLYFYRFSGTSITDSVNVLKQIASLRVARDMARERMLGHQDMLQKGDLDGFRLALDAHHEQLLRQPFSEEIFKFNQLIRKRAYIESFRVLKRLLGKDGPRLRKIAIFSASGLKLLLGIDNYRLLGYRITHMFSGK